MALTRKAAWKMFGCTVQQFTHASSATGTQMRFTITLPPQAADGPVPALYYLSGLTCTDDNVTQKGFAQHAAAKYGVAVVAPDTSPDHAEGGGLGLAGEGESYDFGSGAGFYLDATVAPWAGPYAMESYVSAELPALVEEEFRGRVRPGVRGITGHSMGGHGALTLALRHPEVFHSVSAFAPICAPSACPWGQKAFDGYLGSAGRGAWAEHDACALLRSRGALPHGRALLVDQGGADSFLGEDAEGAAPGSGAVNQLLPEHLRAACAEVGQPLELRLQAGYDHSYFFIASFMEDHVRHHAEALHKL